MVEWGRTGETITATGRAGEVHLTTVDWTPTPPARQLPYPVDAALAGRVAALDLPSGAATLDDGSGPRAVTNGDVNVAEALVAVDAAVETFVRFGGAATLDTSGDGLTLRFDSETPVSLGFRDDRDDPDSITVPPTPAGLAAAVTTAGGDLAPLGPERSRPVRRPHPPLVSFDEGAASPETERSLVLRVPDDLEHVLVAAPFAYYLGAELVTESRTAPLLEAAGIGFERPYGTLPTFASEVAADVRRAFYFDCLARESPAGHDVDRSPLSSLGLDAASVREVSPAVRYATYLDAPVDAIDLPAWHLSTYVDPTYEHARSVPYLLDRLSLVYPAEASELEPRDLLERSLDDFFRGEVVSVSPVDPDLGVGTSHAWLAAGEPVEAFKTTTRAHENRLATRPEGDVTVAVVVNDPEMAPELTVADTYRDAPLPLSVHVHESLRTDDLAAVLERDVDFLHYVGHCEVDGLRCPDGHLSASSLARSGATTFFLNACGSYHEGETLVEKGSVAGGVTLDKVLNEQATRVGTAFGRLLVHGFGIDRALSLARRRIMMGQDYAVVGDGTFALTPTCGDPAVVEVDRLDCDRFGVEYAVASTRAAGATYRDPLTDRQRLYGTSERAVVDRSTLTALLERVHAPVVFDGDLRWSERLRDEIGSETAH
ncbi:hypothetical protein [Halorarius litoreus]|uniref:hypothetical protein n=1 Tax=Halorarius litoreus TaxID=2962676 RepID=UPI0020CD6AE8|nr:hypothetical protein [Halorarius litoreus]